MNPKIEHKISNISAFFLISSAIVFDLLSLIPLVGTLFALPIGFAYGLYFYIKGFGLMTPRMLVAQSIEIIGEVIPFIQALPCLTTGVILMISASRIEERTGKNPINIISSKKKV